MPMGEEIIKKLQIPQMVSNNTDNHETAFTVSIDHVDTTTGISAAERSITAMKCVDEDAKPEDFRRPGHMFPLLAKANGVLERNGHTEATVDLMKLAGLKECGLCCEIMRDDGTMMRTPELKEMAQKYNLKFITIRALQEYRKVHDKLVEQVAAVKMPTKYGNFRAYGYINKLNGEHHVALVKGDIGDGKDVLCRVHSECLTGDVFGSERCDCGEQFAKAMEAIEREGRGILLDRRQEGRCLLYTSGMAWIVVGFYTYTGVWGKDVAWIDILLFYTAVALYTWLSKRSIEKEKKYCNAGVGTAVFVLTFILFLVFTVQPPKIGLFQDPQMGSVNVSKMLV